MWLGRRLGTALVLKGILSYFQLVVARGQRFSNRTLGVGLFSARVVAVAVNESVGQLRCLFVVKFFARRKVVGCRCVPLGNVAWCPDRFDGTAPRRCPLHPGGAQLRA